MKSNLLGGLPTSGAAAFAFHLGKKDDQIEKRV